MINCFTCKTVQILNFLRDYSMFYCGGVWRTETLHMYYVVGCILFLLNNDIRHYRLLFSRNKIIYVKCNFKSTDLTKTNKNEYWYVLPINRNLKMTLLPIRFNLLECVFPYHSLCNFSFICFGFLVICKWKWWDFFY